MPPESIEKAALWFAGAERAIALHARGIEHQSKGVENVLSVINLCLATGNIGTEGRGCMMITGQGNGQGGREHGQKCDQLPGQRSIIDPEARRHVAKVWGIAPEDIPQAGYSAVEIMEAIHRGEIKALLSICFNPLVSLPDAGFTQEALEKLEFFGVVDFFLLRLPSMPTLCWRAVYRRKKRVSFVAPKAGCSTFRKPSIRLATRGVISLFMWTWPSA